MKKIFLLFATAIMLFSSCSKDEDINITNLVGTWDGKKENDESFKVFPLCDIRYPYHADFSVPFGINHAYGYHIDRIERRPTLVSLLIFTLSLPALYTESQSVGVPDYYFSSKGNMSKYLPNFFRCTLISKKKSIYS